MAASSREHVFSSGGGALAAVKECKHMSHKIVPCYVVINTPNNLLLHTWVISYFPSPTENSFIAVLSL